MNYTRWAVLTGVATWMTVALIFYRGIAVAAQEFAPQGALVDDDIDSEKHLEQV